MVSLHLHSLYGVTLFSSHQRHLCPPVWHFRVQRVGSTIQNIRRVDENSGPILSRLWTKVHEIFRRCRKPLVVSNALFRLSVLCLCLDLGARAEAEKFSRKMFEPAEPSRKNFDVIILTALFHSYLWTFTALKYTKCHYLMHIYICYSLI